MADKYKRGEIHAGRKHSRSKLTEDDFYDQDDLQIPLIKDKKQNSPVRAKDTDNDAYPMAAGSFFPRRTHRR